MRKLKLREGEVMCSMPHSQSVATLEPESHFPPLSLVLLYKHKIPYENELLLFFPLISSFKIVFMFVESPCFINSITFQGQSHILKKI